MVGFQAVEELFPMLGNPSLTYSNIFLVSVLVCMENKLYRAFNFHLFSKRKTYNNTLSFFQPRS